VRTKHDYIKNVRLQKLFGGRAEFEAVAEALAQAFNDGELERIAAAPRSPTVARKLYAAHWLELEIPFGDPSELEFAVRLAESPAVSEAECLGLLDKWMKRQLLHAQAHYANVRDPPAFEALLDRAKEEGVRELLPW